MQDESYRLGDLNQLLEAGTRLGASPGKPVAAVTTSICSPVTATAGANPDHCSTLGMHLRGGRPALLGAALRRKPRKLGIFRQEGFPKPFAILRPQLQQAAKRRAKAGNSLPEAGPASAP